MKKIDDFSVSSYLVEYVCECRFCPDDVRCDCRYFHSMACISAECGCIDHSHIDHADNERQAMDMAKDFAPVSCVRVVVRPVKPELYWEDMR